MAIKNYVLDTNVLLADSESLFKFEEHMVHLPIVCIEELDTFKKDQGELGRNARKVARSLNELMSIGSLSDGVSINKHGGVLKIELSTPVDYYNLTRTNDNDILATAKSLNGILVSKDINLRVKAAALGVQTEDYKNDKVKSEEGLYTGLGEIYITSPEIDKLYDNKYFTMDVAELSPSPNQCFVVKSTSNDKHSALVCYNATMNEFRLIPQDLKTMDILPRNTEQQFALSLLLDPNIKLVTLTGKAGSGKGLISLAAALKQVLDDKLYAKIVIARPIVSLNNAHQLGFQPGDLDNKLSHWLKPFYENINYILSNRTKVTKISKVGKRRKDIESYDNEMEKEAGRIPFVDELKELDILELASLEHVKGRTFHNQLVIVTEAQNCSLADMKTIVTRIGEGSKLILEGDIHQIDSPYLDSENNGLTHVAEKFRPYNLSAHITLQKSERSELAELAANIL